MRLIMLFTRSWTLAVREEARAHKRPGLLDYESYPLD